MDEDPLFIASKLHKEAKDIIQKTEIMPTLEKFGDTELAGSYSYNLMAWPDIDIHVYIPDLNEETAFKALKDIYSLRELKRAEIVSGEIVKPGVVSAKGAYYIRTKKRTDHRKWNFDIWLFPMDKPTFYSSKDDPLPEDWYKELTEDQRRGIVAEKLRLIADKDYHPGTSTKIYKEYI